MADGPDLSAAEALRIVDRFPDALCTVCIRRTEAACCECQIRQDALRLVNSLMLERVLAEQAREAEMTDFDRFWRIYPKKEKKQEARKAWRKLDPSPALVETIMNAVRLRSKSWDWRKEKHAFVPMASAYLNGRRWEDEWEDRTEPKKGAAAGMGARAGYEQHLLTDEDFAAMFADLG